MNSFGANRQKIISKTHNGQRSRNCCPKSAKNHLFLFTPLFFWFDLCHGICIIYHLKVVSIGIPSKIIKRNHNLWNDTLIRSLIYYAALFGCVRPRNQIMECKMPWSSNKMQFVMGRRSHSHSSTQRLSAFWNFRFLLETFYFIPFHFVQYKWVMCYVCVSSFE